MTLKPKTKKGDAVSRSCFVVKPVLVPESVANGKKEIIKSKKT